jgi:hypothetical protein
LSGLELSNDDFNLRQPILGQGAEAAVKIADLPVGEPIRHEKAVLVELNQSRRVKNPQMLRRVGNTQARFPRQGFHGPGRLAQQVKQFQPGWARYRFANPAKLFVDGFPRGYSWHVMFCAQLYFRASCSSIQPSS